MGGEGTGRTHISHEHPLELKNQKKPYNYDGCKEPGFRSRYRCEVCDFDLHKDCMFPINPGITLQLSTIKPLTGNNFEEWFESFNVHMTLHNLDMALRVDKPSGVKDHIIKLKHYFNKANEMKVELGEKFLKWLIPESLPTSFDAVKLTYNALKEEWTLEELMSIVVQHEVSLKKN
ncbi:hypothetical protein CK203_048329 [Vitis vinifera]|uniref:DC1 domain-containing protein n=1 Tax=Vitis vinifera TaxID=29760 RepID=A0A438HRK1_VITVI|nr:hypothetical protein CK203_048329 [Vitis vinifera]